MALVIHPYIMGAPHRPKYFRRIFETIRQKPDVAFMTGEQNFSTGIFSGVTGPKATIRLVPFPKFVKVSDGAARK